jgi:hypothetical protein
MTTQLLMIRELIVSSNSFKKRCAKSGSANCTAYVVNLKKINKIKGLSGCAGCAVAQSCTIAQSPLKPLYLLGCAIVQLCNLLQRYCREALKSPLVIVN